MNYEKTIKGIASKIREIRKSRNMTIQELAYRCDMERSNISRIEGGKTNLTVETLCKICSALDIEFKDIID